MVKVKIIKANDFSFSEKTAIYKAILKNKKERIEGDIEVNFINEAMEVNFKRRLSYYEKIAVLKEIFYEFCLNDIKFFRTSVNIPVEVFTFIDRNEENKQELSIIKEILNYNISEFNQNKNREKIISNIKISYDLIKKEIENGNKEILLNQLFRFNI